MDLRSPSGVALHGGTLFVTDHATGWIYAYGLVGARLNRLDTGLGAGAS